MKREWEDFRIAGAFLTVFPVGRGVAMEPERLGRSMGLFPAVGLALGVGLVILNWVAHPADTPGGAGLSADSYPDHRHRRSAPRRHRRSDRRAGRRQGPRGGAAHHEGQPGGGDGRRRAGDDPAPQVPLPIQRSPADEMGRPHFHARDRALDPGGAGRLLSVRSRRRGDRRGVRRARRRARAAGCHSHPGCRSRGALSESKASFFC